MVLRSSGPPAKSFVTRNTEKKWLINWLKLPCEILGHKTGAGGLTMTGKLLNPLEGAPRLTKTGSVCVARACSKQF